MASYGELLNLLTRIGLRSQILQNSLPRYFETTKRSLNAMNPTKQANKRQVTFFKRQVFRHFYSNYATINNNLLIAINNNNKNSNLFI